VPGVKVRMGGGTTATPMAATPAAVMAPPSVATKP